MKNILNITSLKNGNQNEKRKQKYWQADLELGSPTPDMCVCVCHVSFVMRKKKISTYERLDRRHENTQAEWQKKAELFFYFIRDNNIFQRYVEIVIFPSVPSIYLPLLL